MTTAVAEEDALWAAVADPTRRRVLDALLERGEATTTTLANGSAGHQAGCRQASRRYSVVSAWSPANDVAGRCATPSGLSGSTPPARK